jgi:hypothetical protein
MWQFLLLFVGLISAHSSSSHHHHSSHSSGHGRGRRPPNIGVLSNGELFANFSVDCSVNNNGPSPIVTLHYKNLTVLPNVDNIFIHACNYRLPFVIVQPETQVFAGMSGTQFHVGSFPNQEIIRVTNPQTLSDFIVTYQVPPKRVTHIQLCTAHSRWSVHVANEQVVHNGGHLVKGPLC